MDYIQEVLEENLSYLKDLADKGDKFYEYEYAMALLTNEHYEEAIKYLESSSSKGYEDATYCLGICYEQGIYYEENIEKAKELYNKLIEMNSGYGYKGLADLMFYSESTDEEKEEALKLYNEGTNKDYNNYFYCDFELGVIYKRGLYVKKDMDKAIKHFLNAYEMMDDPEISLTLGGAYLFGTNGLNKDLTKAHDLLLDFMLYVTEEDEDLLKEFKDLTKKYDDKVFFDNLLKEAKEKENVEDECSCGEHHHHHHE